MPNSPRCSDTRQDNPPPPIGQWRIDRRIVDQNLRRCGRFTGVLSIDDTGDRTRAWREHGTLTLGDYRGEAWQHYRLIWVEADSPRWQLQFADGRPFIDLISGAAFQHLAHDCAPDRYRGRIRHFANRHWWLGWRISGPRKRLLIVSRFVSLTPPLDKPTPSLFYCDAANT